MLRWARTGHQSVAFASHAVDRPFACAFSYGRGRETPEVVFVRGAIYRYFKFPSAIGGAMATAFAKGNTSTRRPRP
jgi:hypothetical protein